jgi:hypothetical protein
MVYNFTFFFTRILFLLRWIVFLFFKQKQQLLLISMWIVILGIPFCGIAQNPGGVSGEVLWYKANSGVSLVSGNVAVWNDSSTSANNATQVTTANQPAYTTNGINFNQAVTFSGTNYLSTPTNNLPSGSNARTIFVVATSSNTQLGNSWVYGYGTASLGAAFNVGKAAAKTTLYASGDIDDSESVSSFWAANVPKLGRVTYSVPTVSFFDAGAPIGTGIQTGWNTIVAANSGRIGSYVNSTSNQWNGNIAEVIMYPSVVTGTAAVSVESYLAIKYGIHKTGNYISSTGTVVWDALANVLYDNDVFGIAQDDGSGLLQTKSNSVNNGSGDGTGQTGKGNVIISDPALLANNGFLLVGHDAGVLAETNVTVVDNLTKRVQRIWKVQSTGNPGTVTLSYDKTGLTYSGVLTSDYVLLVDPTGLGVFDGESVVKYTATGLAGNKVSFNDVDLPNGAVFTFQTLLVPAMPTVQATNLVFSNVTGTSAIASWTNGNGISRAVFMREVLTGSPVPIDNTTYTANTVFGSGTQIGSTGWYCVYNGTGTAVAITGLILAKTYQVMTVEYNASAPGNEVYHSTISIGNPGQIITNNNVALTGPGGVVNEVIWYKANAGITLNGSNVSEWDDSSGNANDATQTTPANQPVYTTNAINFNQAATLSGSTYLKAPVNNLPSGTADRSIFVVATSTNTQSTNGWLYGYGTNSGGQGNSVGKVLSTSSLYLSGYSRDAQSNNGFWIANVPKLGTITYTAPTFNFFDAGNPNGIAVQASFNTVLTANGGRIGTFANTASEFWRGHVAEIIVYPSVVTGTDALKIESYLALKYGIHKAGNYISGTGTVVWDAIANVLYDNDVFGMAQDDASVLLQTQSNSANTGSGDGTGQTGKGNIIISNASSLANNGFLLIGHDTGLLTEISAIIGGNSIKRVQRTWKAQTTGNPGTVTLSYDTTGLTYAAQSATDYVLLVDPTGLGVFDGGSVVKYTATAITANKVTFNTVSLPTGDVFTIQTLGVPTVQATDIAFAGTTATSTTVSWTNGNGSLRAVFIYAGASGSPLPVDLTTYTANPAFGAGTQIGTTGWYCVYKGTGTSVNLSGLTPSTTYQVMTVEFNGAVPGTEIYLSVVGIGNPAEIITNTNSGSSTGPGGVITGLQLWLDASNGAAATAGNLTAWTDRTAINTFAVSATPPTVNNNAINFHPTVVFDNATGTSTYPATQNLIGNTSITYTDGYAVFKVNNSTGGTVIGSTIAGNSYGRAVFSESGSRMYTGNGNSSTFSSFPYADYTNFHVFAMEKNSSTTIIGRLDANNQVMNNQGTYSSISFIPTVGTTNNNGNGTGWPHLKGQIAEVVLYSQSAGAQKANIESYLALKYGIHKIDNYVGSDNTIIWDATNNSAYHNDVFGIGIDDLSGLSQSISNSMNTGGGDGTGQSGKGNIVISNPTALANNKFLVIGHNISALTEANVTVAGTPTKRVQRIWKVQSTGNPGNVTLGFDVTGLTYSAQNSNDYILLVDPTGVGVFDGGTVVKYPAALLSGNKITFNSVALPTGSVFTFQTLATPTVQATDVVFNGTTGTTTTTSWTNGNGASRAVFMFAGASGSSVPVDATTYTGNTTFGTGTQIRTTGWFCVYNGTGTTVDVTGLIPATTYQVMTVEYNGPSGNELYLSTTSTGNPAGVTTFNNVATLNNLSLSAGTLAPVFATGTTSYSANVANTVSNLTVIPTTTDSNATVTVNGTVVISGSPSDPINLVVGPNIITTVVTAQDGTTTGTYTVTVTRALAPPIITNFSPQSGSVSATTVTITGTNFGATIAENIVFFGAVKATVTAASTTSLTVTVPTGATFEPISVLNTASTLIGYSIIPFSTTFTPNKARITIDDIQPKVNFATAAGVPPFNVIIIDLDGDGKSDLVTVNSVGTGSVSFSVTSQ